MNNFSNCIFKENDNCTALTKCFCKNEVGECPFYKSTEEYERVSKYPIDGVRKKGENNERRQDNSRLY